MKIDKDDFLTLLETGRYSWNTSDKTAFFAPDKVMSEVNGSLVGEQELIEDFIILLNSPEGSGYLPSGYTAEQFAEEIVDEQFAVKIYYYMLTGDIISSFSILNDTGTLIGSCSYSSKMESDTGRMHYSLNISFDEALSIIIDKYGQPKEGWALQSSSSLTSGTGWVILENSPYDDVRLIKSVSGTLTVKGRN